MILSRTTRYALRAGALLAERYGDNRPATVGEISEELDIPRNYLSKTLHALVQRGVLTSERGPNGGFRLAAGPDELKLSRIVYALEPGIGEQICLLGRSSCSDDAPCSAHDDWRRVTAALEDFLQHTTVGDLNRQKSKRRRTSPAKLLDGRRSR